MKLTTLCLFFLLLNTSFQQPQKWGFFGHKRINRLAVFTLPTEMLPFFKKHIDYLTEQAIAPDKRRYIVPTEGYRHYINLDKWTFLPAEKMEAQILHTAIFVVGEKRDTSLLVDYQSVRKSKRDFILKSKNIKRLFGRDSVAIADSALRRFFVYNLLKIQPDEPMPIALDSLTNLFKKEGLILRGVKSVFARDQLTTNGILPYHLITLQRQLTDAFLSKNEILIKKMAAEIGHYISDAHVPLHTVANYDGQYTNQNGIHGFWEGRLPEVFADNQYDFYVGRATYFEQARKHYWDMVFQSNQLVFKTLEAEKVVAKRFGVDKKYCSETVNGVVIQKPCFDFLEAYHAQLGGMVEGQMRRAILAVGSAWLTAWMDAGQPDLSNLKIDPLSINDQKEQQTAEQAIKNGGKMMGRAEGN